MTPMIRRSIIRTAVLGKVLPGTAFEIVAWMLYLTHKVSIAAPNTNIALSIRKGMII